MAAAVSAVALVAALALVLRYGSPGLRRAGWALAANMLAVWAAQAVTQSYAPWPAFIAIDALTAMVVLSHPASRAQATIGAIFVFQIIIHVAFGVAGPAPDTRLYLDLLAFGWGCQLLILATGAIHGRGRKVVGAGGGGGGAPRAAGADMARVELRP